MSPHPHQAAMDSAVRYLISTASIANTPLK